VSKSLKWHRIVGDTPRVVGDRRVVQDGSQYLIQHDPEEAMHSEEHV
jgi:hypothetical protein